MIAEKTSLKGCFILKNTIFKDERGYFFESFNQKVFNKAIGRTITFVQDNESFSSKNVLRGIHLQIGIHAQAKLVSVVKGRILDIVVDLRKHSPTFGEHLSIELNDANKKQVFIPRGFGHGFVVLSETAIFSYKCDNYYNKAAERGIIYNDKDLNIDWQISDKELIISEKDKVLPKLKDANI